MRRHLKNLISSQLVEGPAPWEFNRRELVPAECLGQEGKPARDRWINSPRTEYHVYSMFEGSNAGQRISKSANGGEGNPPVFMHGLAVDYDADITVEEVRRVLHRFGIRTPAWFERTLSDNGRLVWLFERPLPLPSRDFTVRLLEEFKGWLNLGQIPGLDFPALRTPERYYTNGGEWTKLSDYVIPFDELQGFVLKISEKFQWTAREAGNAVSFEAITEECRRRYPRFASDWPFPTLALGQQGPSFWVEGSTSPKSAIVTEIGMQTFAAHAIKGLYTWKEIVGAQFVESVEEAHMGAAIRDIYTDGKTWFIREETTGQWQDYDIAGVRRRLQVRGMSDRKGRGETADDVTRAIDHMSSNSRVDIAASCPFYPKGLFTYNGRRILNLHRIDALAPAAEPAIWGPSGQFPFLSSFIDNFFDPIFPQKDIFLAWTKQFYSGCHNRTPGSGHTLFLCGPPNSGKTFLSNAVVGGLVGGCANANAFFNGIDSFNSDMFEHALWAMDDGHVSSTAAGHRRFSETVKSLAANRLWRMNEKFRKASNVPWQGRGIVTCNDDPESLQQLPNLDISIREKLILCRVGTRKVDFFSSDEMTQILGRELSYFARFLLDWSPPEHCFEGADVRFVIRAYCEPSLARAANLSNGQAAFVELLLRWVNDYFKGNPGMTEWKGTATDLRLAMSCDVAYNEMLRVYRIEHFSRMLVSTASKSILHLKIEDSDNGTARIFRIPRPQNEANEAKSELPSENTRFEK